jgi:hypothetical protein
LLGDLRIVTGYLCLAGLEQLDLLLDVCEIAHYRLEQLCQLGRHGGGRRRDVLQLATLHKLLLDTVRHDPVRQRAWLKWPRGS